MIKEDEMPLASYTIIHRDAVLSMEQKLAVTDWCSNCMEAMKATHTVDSLIKKRTE